MALPTPVNGQITDSVTQSNIMVLASAVPTALGSLYQVFASSLGTGSSECSCKPAEFERY